MLQRDPQSTEERYRSLTDRARIEGIGVWLTLLQDRSLWNEAPTWAQDQAILATARKHGPAFQFTTTDVYECGGQRHRIASFRFLGSDPAIQPLPQRNPLDWIFRLVPGGNFTMGSPDSDEHAFPDEQPARELRVPPLLVAATPTTQAMWTLFASRNLSCFKEERRPVDNIGWGWDEVLRWTESAGSGLRLPCEGEWEYSCRAGTSSSFCFGDDPEEIRDYAIIRENSKQQTGFVGIKKANAFGLYDVHGNVSELCGAPRQSNAGGARNHGVAGFFSTADVTSWCVARGGSFLHEPRYCRSAFRERSWSGRSRGFRLFRSITESR